MSKSTAETRAASAVTAESAVDEKSPIEAGSALKIVADATCTFCGCVCDDIELHVEDEQIVEAKRACVLGKAWFLNHEIEDRPSCYIEGRPAAVAEGIERAAQILATAKYPLMYGLSDTTVRIPAGRGGNRRLDRRKRGHDHQCLPRPVGHGVSRRRRSDLHAGRSPQPGRSDHLLGLESGGKPPAAFHPVQPDAQGDVRAPTDARTERAWSSMSARPSQPRPPTSFCRSNRERTSRPSGRCAHWPADIELDPQLVEQETGQPLAVWQDLMERMKAARFGVIFFGMGLTMTRGKHCQQRSLAGADPRHEPVHAVCLQTESRPRKRHRSRQCRDLANRISLRRQPGPRLSAVQSGRIHGFGCPCSPRSRCGVDHRQRSDGQLQPTRTRSPDSRFPTSPWIRKTRPRRATRPSPLRWRPTASTCRGPSTAWTTSRSRCDPPLTRPTRATFRYFRASSGVSAN